MRITFPVLGPSRISSKKDCGQNLVPVEGLSSGLRLGQAEYEEYLEAFKEDERARYLIAVKMRLEIRHG